MCQAISLILTAKRVIRIPGVESHNDIITISSIGDTAYPPSFVAGELLPPDSNDPEVWLDWRRWRVSWDQDQFPGWFVEPVDRERVYDWAERNARVVKDAEIVTGHIDLLAGKCGEVVGPCTIARCAPGASLYSGGRAIVKHGGDLSVTRGHCMNVKHGDCMSIEDGECMSVYSGSEMSVGFGSNMNVEYGDRMSVRRGGGMVVKYGSNMSVERGERMTVLWGTDMTVENLENARILDRETD